MNKPRNFFKDTYHHIYNRGANKQKIFFDTNDYLYFLKQLNEYKNKFHITVLCYCLLPNHFHMFLKQNTNEYPISLMLSHLINSYTKTINKKYKKSGVLFESKTKSKYCDDEIYFKWIFKYILSNPVKDGLVKYSQEWEFSNAKELFGLRNVTLCDNEEVYSFFDTKEQFLEFITNEKNKVVYDVW